MDAEFDPVTLEILWSRLISIADESAAALVRTSFSTIVRESNDYACALLDAEGNSLAESTVSIPAFIGTLPRTLRHFLRRFPAETLEPGDAILTNDPWMATGHLHDFTLAAPVFYHGVLVAFAGNIAHTPDIGGSMWTADARELYEEGLRVMPVKLMKAGRLNEELAELIRANVRVPEQVMGDLHAQVAAAEVCGRKLVELLEEQEMDDLSALGTAIQDRAEIAMRRAIDAVPDGEYSYSVETDGFDFPLTIQARVTVQGSELEVDFEGSSAQIDRGLNSVYNYTYAYTTYPLKCILDPNTPKNGGSFRPITIKAPEGTILNPRYPAPVDARQLTGHYLTAAVFGALSQAIPDRVIADSGGPPTRIVYAGTGFGGEKFSQIVFPWGGMGARRDQDGLSCTPFPSNSGCGSFEAMESISPLLFWQRLMIPDSGGPGRSRGGLGQDIVIELLSPEPARVNILSERLRHPPLGLLGGHPGHPAGLQLNESDPIPAKGRTIFKPGDVVRLRYAGGGGYGPPKERVRERVLHDLKNDLITPEAARTIYGLEV
jgi:N-methylhydantoinase B